MAYGVYGDGMRDVVEEMRDFISEKMPLEWLARHKEGCSRTQDECRERIDATIEEALEKDGRRTNGGAIGEDVCREIDDIGAGLWVQPTARCGMETFDEGEPVYTCGEDMFVSERDWRSFWSEYPWWYEYVYLLCGNDDGDAFTYKSVGLMTPADVVEAGERTNRKYIYRTVKR